MTMIFHIDLSYETSLMHSARFSPICRPYNFMQVIDKSFGFDTAVEEAQRAINAAHVEAESMENGVGIVKLMGRYSGNYSLVDVLGDVPCTHIYFHFELYVSM